MINITSELNDGHKNSLKEEIMEEITEKLMENLQDMINQKVQHVLKKYQVIPGTREKVRSKKINLEGNTPHRKLM
jgi:predicted house-cleaning noncanonical NTP pyrophosphatase (MazG superfamily)